MSRERVLVADPDRLLRDFLADHLRRKQFDVVTADSKEQAQEKLCDPFSILIIDAKFIGKAEQKARQVPIVILTSFSDIGDVAHQGIFHCLAKPFSEDAFDLLIEKAREHLVTVEEGKLRRDSAINNAPLLIAESAVMKQLLVDVRQIAKSHASVLISGESGTGKEVIAHLIHFHSLRADKPFIRVNCAAMPETLIESEFFGHEKGAFTGANARRLGRFELAHEGTLLLDEVTEIPIGLQAKLLRAVQEQEFERVGGAKPVQVNVRIISTTNRDIKEAIAQKVLREDLFYRLNVVPVFLPPLRERRDDIIPLAEYFLNKTCLDNHRTQKHFTPDAKKRLLEYFWPGNIRELANVIERAVVLDSSLYLEAQHLQLDHIIHTTPICIPVGMTLEEAEKRLILGTLKQHQNDFNKTAEILGISVHLLKNRMERYSL